MVEVRAIAIGAGLLTPPKRPTEGLPFSNPSSFVESPLIA